MQVRKNKLKAALKSGENAYGIWNGIPDVYVAELCAGAGFDFVCIDGEHAPFTLDSIKHNLVAVQSHGVSAIVRPPSADLDFLKQLMELGVQSFIIPVVESGEVAADLAKAIVYPPKGNRGVGSALSRAAQWNRVGNYFSDADDQMCMIVQVESVPGVQALDDILAVEGIDCVFIGPADLAASMGYLGQPRHPEVVKVIEMVLRKTRAAGKAAGIMNLTVEGIKEYKGYGANLLAVAIDTIILKNGTQKLARAFNPTIAKGDSGTLY